MSRAAEDYVNACTHPKVNAVARDLLLVIARLIPEGQTTTPSIGMGDLATSARLHRRTVWRWLDVLVAIGEVRLVDGGQGRPARYTLVHVPGAAPMTAAPLPLRADLQPVPRRPRPPSDTPDLFDEAPIVRSESEELVIQPITRITRITSWAARTITRITSWAADRITRITSWRSEGEELVIGTCDPCDPTCDPALPLDVAGTRARDVHTLKNVHTPAPARDGPTLAAVPPPRCRWAGKSHAWCEGRVHVPTELHREFLRKFGRLHGETDVDVDRELRAFYALTCATLPPEELITENDFAFWRRCFAATFATVAPASKEPPRRGDGVTSGSVCSHEPRCDTYRACIDRTLAEGRAARQRKSG